MRLRLILGTAFAAAVLLGPAPAAFADSSVPYSDPNAVGLLTICDQNGNAVTSGSVNAVPFAWRVVSSEPAQPPYNAVGRTATLFAYQPREQVYPGEWSGYQLTASAKYTNTDHPMAAFTNRDGSLAEFLDQFPPQWDGLVQLRIYLSAPQQPAYTQTYPTADLKISGDTWTLVNGGTDGCDSGKALSLEHILPRVSPSAGSGQSAGAGSGDSTSPSPSPSGTGAGSPATAGSVGAGAVSQSGGTPVATILFVVAGLGLIIGAGIWYARGRGSDTS